jgi:hypothetical protein
VAGAYFNSAGDEIGFLYHGGKYYDVINPKATTETKPDGVNDTLEMVGRYVNSAGATLGFKAITKTYGDVFASTLDASDHNTSGRHVVRLQPLNTP